MTIGDLSSHGIPVEAQVYFSQPPGYGIILIDQFKRPHPTDKITFAWVGTTEPPKPPPLAPKQLETTITPR
jgi:hypothetical protein